MMLAAWIAVSPFANVREWIGLGAIIAATMILLRIYLRTRRRDPAIPRERQQANVSLREHDAMRRDIERLMIELEELSRRISGQVETRYRKLEVVIEDADKRIQELETLIAVADRAADRTANAIPKRVPSGDATEAATRSVQSATQSRPSPRPRAANANSRPATAQPAVVDTRSRIYQLADQGMSITDVSKATGVAPGEVELILNLRQT